MSGPRKKTFLATSFGLRFGFMASSSSSRALVEFLIFQGTKVRPRISAPLERPPVHGVERGSTGRFSGAARDVIVPDPDPHLVLLRSLRPRETSSYEAVFYGDLNQEDLEVFLFQIEKSMFYGQLNQED